MKVSDLRSADYRAEQALPLRVFVNYRGMSYACVVRIPSCYLHRFRGGYAGLRWLAAPDSSTDQRPSASAKLPNKGKKLPEKSDSNVTTMTEAESGPKDRDKTEITASTAPSGTSNKVAPEASRNETGVSEVSPKAPTQKDDVPGGECTPIGVTASGKLVFPMQCQAFLEPHRGPEDFQVPLSTNPPETVASPKERQEAEPAPSADQITGLNREGSFTNEAN